MYCPHCGTANDNNNFKCVKCSQAIQGTPVFFDTSDSAAMRMLLPVGRSGLAIAAGYAALFAPLIVPAPLALVLGILAVRDIRKNPKKHGMGRAVFGVVTGVLGTAVLVWLLASGVM